MNDSQWTGNVRELTSKIRAEYHGAQRDLLAEIDVLIDRVLNAHFLTHAKEMIPLFEAYQGLRMKLLLSYAKKEKRIFMEMKQTAADPDPNAPFLGVLDDVGAELVGLTARVDETSNHYTSPPDGCPTYDLMMAKLKELSESVEDQRTKEAEYLLPTYKGE